MSISIVLSALLIFLFSTFFLNVCATGLRGLRRGRERGELRATVGRFWSQKIAQRLFPRGGTSLLLFWIIFAQNLCRFGYTSLAIALLVDSIYFQEHIRYLVPIGELILFFAASLVITDLLPQLWINKAPRAAMRLATPPASIVLLLALPLAYPFLRIFFNLTRDRDKGDQVARAELRERILELLDEGGPEITLDATERKLITAAVTFRDRIVREVMVPRGEIFSISGDTPIKEAAHKIREERYSRVPVYGKSLDEVTGILMYRELLDLYMRCMSSGDKTPLSAAVVTIAKPVFYVPETKKIADLLHDFRNRQTHLAIVVDEYGATEGVVTIEDLLEELVGEIADEYDEEEVLFSAQPNGSWMIDARMSVYDVEEQLGFKIPQDAEYDTVGGYLVHRAGAVPQTGFMIHHDTFELEVVKRSDRAIQKVLLTPHK